MGSLSSLASSPLVAPARAGSPCIVRVRCGVVAVWGTGSDPLLALLGRRSGHLGFLDESARGPGRRIVAALRVEDR